MVAPRCKARPCADGCKVECEFLRSTAWHVTISHVADETISDEYAGGVSSVPEGLARPSVYRKARVSCPAEPPSISRFLGKALPKKPSGRPIIVMIAPASFGGHNPTS